MSIKRTVHGGKCHKLRIITVEWNPPIVFSVSFIIFVFTVYVASEQIEQESRSKGLCSAIAISTQLISNQNEPLSRLCLEVCLSARPL
ncbi:hypothetical protein OUZ56_003067 [Daphnia magna]|uniref:Uncharacterized protein n=1 Tax=Daphnia magna TaxID=35525 RepID=A0ABR0A7L9_9CRUS|nr:hypothetical protein OUZ56_003067 [Daphnia magna]